MQTGKIKTRCCSPVNRILLLFYKKVFYHLSSPAVTRRIQLPTPSGLFTPASNKRGHPVTCRNIFGISTRKVYPQNILLYFGVCSYHTFSPLSRPKTRRYIFCGTVLSFLCLSWTNKDEDPPVRWCDALRCPDFPLFHSFRMKQR